MGATLVLFGLVMAGVYVVTGYLTTKRETNQQ